MICQSYFFSSKALVLTDREHCISDSDNLILPGFAQQ